MKKDLMSVIVPAYNEEKNIERTLVSLREQDYRDLEIVVVDNLSTDNTSEIARRYADMVVFFDDEQNPSAARNYGTKISNGNFVAFLDADSCLSRNAIGNAVRVLENDYAGGRNRLLPSENKLVARTQTIILNSWARVIAPQYTPFIYTTQKNFELVGGWNKEIGLGDELDFQRKLQRLGRLKYDKYSFVTTSPRRYQERGYIRTTLLGVLGYLEFDINWKPIRK